MEPTTATVNRALNELEAQELPPSHPRRLARQIVKRWKSDAIRLKLGVCNQYDSGAPSLRTDETLGHGHHDQRIGRR